MSQIVKTFVRKLKLIKLLYFIILIHCCQLSCIVALLYALPVVPLLLILFSKSKPHYTLDKLPVIPAFCYSVDVYICRICPIHLCIM